MLFHVAYLQQCKKFCSLFVNTAHWHSSWPFLLFYVCSCPIFVFLLNTQSFYCSSGICPGPPGWVGTRKVKTRKVKPIWIYWSKRQWVAVASAGPYASLHLIPDNHTNIPPLSFFTGRMPFLPPNQQRQSTQGNICFPVKNVSKILSHQFCENFLAVTSDWCCNHKADEMVEACWWWWWWWWWWVWLLLAGSTSVWLSPTLTIGHCR